MKILITGVSGQVGYFVNEELKTKYQTLVPTSKEFDLSDENSIREYLNMNNPDVIINCAAFTDTKACEVNPTSRKINADSPKTIAQYCKQNSKRLIHVSSDYVFSGKEENYAIYSETNPVNEYGRQKLDAEKNIIRDMVSGYTIIRASWIYSKRAKNFIPFAYGKIINGEEFAAASDQYGASTYAPELAKFILNVLENGYEGIYHFSDDWYGSRYDLAKEMANEENSNVTINKVSITNFENGIVFPRKIKMELSKTKEIFNIKPFIENYKKFKEEK